MQVRRLPGTILAPRSYTELRMSVLRRTRPARRAPSAYPAVPRRLLIFVGVLGCLLALLSVVDMFMAKAYDGVVPDPYSVRGLVRDVVPRGRRREGRSQDGGHVMGIRHPC